MFIVSRNIVTVALASRMDVVPNRVSKHYSRELMCGPKCGDTTHTVCQECCKCTLSAVMERHRAINWQS